ncbi:MAG: helix-turn-helix transcriptional regulator [Opitutaceae bacterium]|nr:helix-turn-helix transcriptional regulator [Opitutaceae bacterium]
MAKRNVALTRFGENVRNLREKRELTQERLSEFSELNQTYISGIENGSRNPTILSVTRIAKALKTTIADLCDGIDR